MYCIHSKCTHPGERICENSDTNHKDPSQHQLVDWLALYQRAELFITNEIITQIQQITSETENMFKDIIMILLGYLQHQKTEEELFDNSIKAASLIVKGQVDLITNESLEKFINIDSQLYLLYDERISKYKKMEELKNFCMVQGQQINYDKKNISQMEPLLQKMGIRRDAQPYQRVVLSNNASMRPIKHLQDELNESERSGRALLVSRDDQSPLNKKMVKEGKIEKKIQKKSNQGRPVVTITMQQLLAKATKTTIHWDRIMYQAYFFAIGLIMLTLSATSYYNYQQHSKDIKLLEDNWNSDIFTDIKIKNSSSLCNETTINDVNLNQILKPFYLKYIDMLTYNWSGTVNGCDCTYRTEVSQKKNLKFIYDSSGDGLNSTNNITNLDAVYNDEIQFPSNGIEQEFLTNTICSSELQRERCSSVPAQNPKLFRFWNDGNWGAPFSLCGKPVPGINYSKQGNRKACEQNEKQCGEGDNLFCVQIDQLCPINYIGFIRPLTHVSPLWNDNNSETQSQIDLIKQLQEDGKNEEAQALGGLQQISEDLIFYYLRGFKNYAPITEIRVTETFQGEGVCLDNKVGNINPFRKEYPLMIQPRQFCQTDQRFVPFYMIDEYQYYLANNANYLSLTLPFYDIDSKNSWGVFYRRYVEWKPHCRTEIFDQTNQLTQDLLELKYKQIGLIAMSIIYFITISLIFTFISCLTACGFKWQCIDVSGRDFGFRLFLTEIIVKGIIQIIQIVIVIWAFSSTNKIKLLLEDLTTLNCSDTQTQVINTTVIIVQKEVFVDFKQVFLQKSWSANISVFLLFFFTFTTDMAILVIAIWQRRKNKNNKVDQQPNLCSENFKV